MIRVVIVLLISFLQIKSFGSTNPSTAYIDQFKDIAISEMHRTGIPASIKLAQGLLESGSGRSTLAREANNHFGIKCGGQWDGEGFYREDDDYNKKGELIKSCFRKYDSAFESYIEHSAFLVNQNRYAFLFSYSHDDYKSWAKGLRKAGYATDKAYPQKLIQLIEKYELWRYDNELTEDLAVNIHKNENITQESDEGIASTSVVAIYEAKHSNKNKSKVKITKFNLEAQYHVVQAGETVQEIAALYHLEENGIRFRNRLPKDAQPLKGERIHLRKKISLLNRPQFIRIPDGAIAASSDEFIF